MRIVVDLAANLKEAESISLALVPSQIEFVFFSLELGFAVLFISAENSSQIWFLVSAGR